MYARFLMIGTAILVAAPAPTIGQPAKAPLPQPTPAKVILASADDVRAPVPTESQAPVPAKRRIARVTTCRCGDPAPEPQTEE